MNVFCTINYKNYSLTEKYIRSFLSLRLDNSILIVVDNVSDNIQLEILKNKFNNDENLFFVATIHNLGYFGGGFLGLEYYRNSISNDTPNVFCITNNDITFEENQNWDEVIYQLTSQNEAVGCIAPCIKLVSSGKNQNPFLIQRPGLCRYLLWRSIFVQYHVTKLTLTVRSMITSFRKKLRSNRKKKTIKENPVLDRKIYAAQGAFFVLTNKFLESNYPHENLPFLYCEEISVAEHCMNVGLNIIQTNLLTVYHDEHASTTSQMTKFKYEKMKEAQNYILKEYYL
jgi:GT2 family glycosyltransferase